MVLVCSLAGQQVSLASTQKHEKLQSSEVDRNLVKRDGDSREELKVLVKVIQKHIKEEKV